MTTKIETKHTPGPWTLGRFGCVTGGAWMQYANGKAQSQIASATVGNGIDPEEREANARLIAAAPELLEALEQGYQLMQDLAEDHIHPIATHTANVM